MTFLRLISHSVSRRCGATMLSRTSQNNWTRSVFITKRALVAGIALTPFDESFQRNSENRIYAVATAELAPLLNDKRKLTQLRKEKQYLESLVEWRIHLFTSPHPTKPRTSATISSADSPTYLIRSSAERPDFGMRLTYICLTLESPPCSSSASATSDPKPAP